MNIRDARSEIIHTIKAYTAKNSWGGYAIPSLRQRPLLLIGPPGIGKTAIMSQAAAACGIGFVSYTMTHHTRQSAMGLPYIEHRQFSGRDYAITEYTMSEIIASVYRTIEETGISEGLLFLDEINCVSETLAPAMLQFLQTKTFGTHRLPEGWVLAAAGNPPEYNKSVREFDIATLDRLKYITIEADFNAWRSYALESGIHGAILSYLDSHPDRFYVLEQTYSHQTFVTARGWEDLSCLLLQYESMQLPVTTALVYQYLHTEDLARDFAGYYNWYLSRKQQLPVKNMLLGEVSALKTCQDLLQTAAFDEQLHLVHLILSSIGNALSLYQKELEQDQRLSALTESLLRSSNRQTSDQFLANERNVIEVRREHGLSSESELEQMQQALYRLQDALYRSRETNAPLSDFFAEESQTRTDNIRNFGFQIIFMLEQAVALFTSVPTEAAYALFLSSLKQNNHLKICIKKFPCPILEEEFAKLDFKNREQQLKEKLAALH